MRVLQVISSVSDEHGGGTTAVWATLKALQTRNVHAELATTNENGHGRTLDVPMNEFVRHSGHRVRFFPYRGDRYVTSWPMARWLWAHVRDYDLLHIHGLFRFAPVAAAHAALLRGVPYVLTLHNVLGQWGMQHRRPLMKRLSISLVEGRVIDRAARVHLCSFNELEQAVKVRMFDGRSRVFPLGLDLPADPPLDRPDRAGTDVGISAEALPGLERLAGHPIVLYMSRIHKIKGLDQLITAFAEIRRIRPDTVLAVAGSGEPELVAELQALAKKLGIAEHTHWLGFVQGRQKQELLSRAAVFVLPSHSENFGFAVVEAIAAGVPVVTSVNVPAGKFVVEADGGIIYDGTKEQLVQSVLQILDMPEEQRRGLGSRAATDVRERLSLRSYGEALERLYREAAAG
jgi:glycosyltransferase involved in cell wall biosynthesis